MISETFFKFLVEAASRAPSSDNIQPWKFARTEDGIEIYCDKTKLLKIDVLNMFTLISIGSAIENIVMELDSWGIESNIRYPEEFSFESPIAFIDFKLSSTPTLEKNTTIINRATNRKAFKKTKIRSEILEEISHDGLNSQTHWITDDTKFKQLSRIDEKFSQILLEHEPLFNGFFETIRFSYEELKRVKCGMDIKSLDIPYLFAFTAKRFKKLKVNRLICRLGLGPSVTKSLASRLTKCGAISLISIKEQNFRGFLNAGRTMERIWLNATERGLSVHPYGIIPQYFTMAKLQPETFSPHHVEIINSSYPDFSRLFPKLKKNHPVILLRIGYANKKSSRNDIRYDLDKVIM